MPAFFVFSLYPTLTSPNTLHFGRVVEDREGSVIHTSDRRSS